MSIINEFNETWLNEMPQNIGIYDTYNNLIHNIKERIQDGSEPQKINELYMIQGSEVQFYWYEDNGIITLGTELYKKPQGLVISITGKNSDYKGKPPYASDLYNDILNLTHRSIKLLSDDKLSDEGFNLWKKLYSKGHKISVYDNTNPGQSLRTIKSIDDLDKFFKNDAKYKRYQFVLSENGEVLAETRSYFNTRRHLELSGLL